VKAALPLLMAATLAGCATTRLGLLK